MDTPALFCESIEEAILEVARCCGGRKTLAAEMWPSLPVRMERAGMLRSAA